MKPARMQMTVDSNAHQDNSACKQEWLIESFGNIHCKLSGRHMMHEGKSQDGYWVRWGEGFEVEGSANEI